MSNNIHPTAIMTGNIKVGNNVEVGPYCVINGSVTLGEGTRLRSHVVIDGNVEIGKHCDIFPFASIGLDPQSYDKRDNGSRLIIGDRNIIRESVTISGGSPKDNLITKIGNDCLFMAYSHVAHDCVLADNIILANNVALAGHVIIDSHVIVGGNSAVHQFTRIGKNAMIGGCSGLNKDIMPFTMFISHQQSEDLAMHSGIMGVNMIGLKRNSFTKSEIISLGRFYNNFLNHSGNRQECHMHIMEKYNKYQNLIENPLHKKIVKDFIEEKSHQGIYREMLKARAI